MVDKIELKEEDLEKVNGGFYTSTRALIGKTLNIENYICPYCVDNAGLSMDSMIESFYADLGDCENLYESFVCPICKKAFAHEISTGKWHELSFVQKYIDQYFS